MQGREILLVVLVVAIALGSGLIGLYLGRTSVQQASVPSQAVGGVDVATGGTRLFDTPQKTNLLYEIDNSGRVYQGSVSQGQTILFFDGVRIYRGANSTGEILFTIEGDRIFVGANTTGPLAYTVKDGRVFEGNETGPVIYTIEGDRLFAGPDTTGDIMFQANKELSGNIRFLLPVLADRRF